MSTSPSTHTPMDFSCEHDFSSLYPETKEPNPEIGCFTFNRTFYSTTRKGAQVKVFEKNAYCIIDLFDVMFWGQKDFHGRQMMSLSYDSNPFSNSHQGLSSIRHLEAVDAAVVKYTLDEHKNQLEHFNPEMGLTALKDLLYSSQLLTTPRGESQRIYLNVQNPDILSDTTKRRKIKHAKIILNHLWFSDTGKLSFSFKLLAITE